MTSDFSQDHFSLFGLAPGFALEQQALDGAYREIQARIHPDRYARAGDAERRASMQWSTRVNEAYRTLRDPVQRARYLLELHGIDAARESDSAMPAEFLVRQMELREQLEAAAGGRDAAALERMHAALVNERRELEAALAERIDVHKDWAGAAGPVRELMFLDKLHDEIDAALAALEA